MPVILRGFFFEGLQTSETLQGEDGSLITQFIDSSLTQIFYQDHSSQKQIDLKQMPAGCLQNRKI